MRLRVCMHLRLFDYIYVAHQIIHGNGGSLAEAHINILDELLAREKPENPAYLEWLGKRYAERCEFQVSREYFKVCWCVRCGYYVLDIWV